MTTLESPHVALALALTLLPAGCTEKPGAPVAAAPGENGRSAIGPPAGGPAVREFGRQRQGSITATKGDLASINLGAAQGVERGSKFAITRDGKLIGHLFIEVVEPRSAAGIVLDAAGPLHPGDRVVPVGGPVGDASAYRAGGEIAGVPGLLERSMIGRITAVRGELASINIGRSHGVLTGMKMAVVSGNRFVGYLRIDTVAAAEAAGLILEAASPPQVGDRVIYPVPGKE